MNLNGLNNIFSRIQQLEDRFVKPLTPPSPGFQEMFLQKQEQLKADEYESVINKYASQKGVDGDLVKAVIKAESDFNWNAVSKKGAVGLMQLMPGTAKELGVANPFDAEENIRGGVTYLRQLAERFGGDISKVLAAYNAGPEHVDKHNGIPPFKETKTFVNRVLDFYRDYKKTK